LFVQKWPCKHTELITAASMSDIVWRSRMPVQVVRLAGQKPLALVFDIIMKPTNS